MCGLYTPGTNTHDTPDALAAIPAQKTEEVPAQ